MKPLYGPGVKEGAARARSSGASYTELTPTGQPWNGSRSPGFLLILGWLGCGFGWPRIWATRSSAGRLNGPGFASGRLRSRVWGAVGCVCPTWPFLRLQIALRGGKAAPGGSGEGGKSEPAQLHARGRCRQRGPGATGHMNNGATRNDPSYGLPPFNGILVDASTGRHFTGARLTEISHVWPRHCRYVRVL
jgi:hypothetical protein